MVRYYFGLASSLWWAILCGCWLLSARNEWSSEALHNIASYLHAVAWGAPVLLTSGKVSLLFFFCMSSIPLANAFLLLCFEKLLE